MAAHQAPLSLGFSRQEHWSGLPFPSPMRESEKWKWSRSVVPTLSDPINCSPPGSSIHGIPQTRVLEWGAILQEYWSGVPLPSLCLWLSTFHLCMYHIFFIHSSVNKHLGCSHGLAIVNSTARNIGVCAVFQMSLSLYFCFMLLSLYPGVDRRIKMLSLLVMFTVCPALN